MSQVGIITVRTGKARDRLRDLHPIEVELKVKITAGPTLVIRVNGQAMKVTVINSDTR